MKELFNQVSANETHPYWQNMLSRIHPIYKRPHDIRSDFERDYNRIIYCNAFRRLKHKTQVFFSPKNDHICTRLEHVYNVEATSYTIAKALGLNTNLTRAISIAHDIGHSPFGHQGEKILNQFAKEDFGESFWHERNGLTIVDDVELLEDTENCKQNLNLTYAVRDGIISHCGEIDENGLKPRSNFIDLTSDYQTPNQYAPYTWEGCVVKISDKIAYLGRDIKDAISTGILDQNLNELYDLLEYPKSKKINNANIISDLIYDVCVNSNLENGLSFSEKTFQTIQNLKDFNYKNIYRNPKLSPSIEYFSLILSNIYQLLKNAYAEKETPKELKKLEKYYPNLILEFSDWISNYWDLNETREHLKNRILYHMDKKEDYYKAIITYISGMTDSYAIQTYSEIIKF